MVDPLVALGTVGLAVIAMISTAIWTVASVRTTTAVLAVELRQLRECIDALRTKLTNSAEALQKLEHRMTLLEERCIHAKLAEAR